MKNFKKYVNPILFVSSIMIINTVLWINRMKAAFLNNESIVTSVIGSILLMGFFLVFLLSTRMKWLVKLFGGLDGLYFWHIMLAIGTTALIFVHQVTSIYNFSSNQTTVFLLGGVGSAGELARNGFF